MSSHHRSSNCSSVGMTTERHSPRPCGNWVRVNSMMPTLSRQRRRKKWSTRKRSSPGSATKGRWRSHPQTATCLSKAPGAKLESLRYSPTSTRETRRWRFRRVGAVTALWRGEMARSPACEFTLVQILPRRSTDTRRRSRSGRSSVIARSSSLAPTWSE